MQKNLRWLSKKNSKKKIEQQPNFFMSNVGVMLSVGIAISTALLFTIGWVEYSSYLEFFSWNVAWFPTPDKELIVMGFKRHFMNLIVGFMILLLIVACYPILIIVIDVIQRCYFRFVKKKQSPTMINERNLRSAVIVFFAYCFILFIFCFVVFMSKKGRELAQDVFEHAQEANPCHDKWFPLSKVQVSLSRPPALAGMVTNKDMPPFEIIEGYQVTCSEKFCGLLVEQPQYIAGAPAKQPNAKKIYLPKLIPLTQLHDVQVIARCVDGVLR